jgi:manganese/zinc/iron transport system permease protein
MNPYTEADFFSFFSVLFHRIGLFLRGDLGTLASDEVQLIVIGLESITCALLGVWLSLRKMTMMANALSHTILLGIVLVYIAFRSWNPELTNGTFHIPLSYLVLAAVGTGLVTTYLVSLLTKHGKVYEDASIGLVFTSLFALGILLVNIATRSAHVGAEAVMGNPDGLLPSDIQEVWPFFLGTVILLILFHRDLLATTFDSLFASTRGMYGNCIHYGLMVLVSFALIGGFRAIGVIMVLAFLTSPALLLRPFVKSIRSYLLLSALIALLFSIVGVALTRHVLTHLGLALSTGGLIVTLMAATTLLIWFLYRLKGSLFDRRDEPPSQVLH